MNISSEFTERLNLMMGHRGLNQASLCELTGLSSAQANHLVNGRTKDPKLSTVCKIALALDVSLDYLGGLIDEPRPIQRDESGRPVFPNLTPSEHEIVDAYRDSDARGQENILETARREKRAQGLPEADVREAK